MNEQATQIIQDTKFLQQLIGKMPEGGNQVNIFMVGQISNKEGAEILGFDFAKYFESLPQPRLKTLCDNAIAEAMRVNKTHEKAAEYLGITRRVLSAKINGGLRE